MANPACFGKLYDANDADCGKCKLATECQAAAAPEPTPEPTPAAAPAPEKIEDKPVVTIDVEAKPVATPEPAPAADPEAQALLDDMARITGDKPAEPAPAPKVAPAPKAKATPAPKAAPKKAEAAAKPEAAPAVSPELEEEAAAAIAAEEEVAAAPTPAAPKPAPKAPKTAPATPKKPLAERSKIAVKIASFIKDAAGSLVYVEEGTPDIVFTLRAGDIIQINNPKSKFNGEKLIVSSFTERYGFRGIQPSTKLTVEFPAKYATLIEKVTDERFFL